jgi:hypothetical protein
MTCAVLAVLLLQAVPVSASKAAETTSDSGAVGIHTVFVLREAIPLEAVAQAIDRTGLRPFSLEHTGPKRGGFHSQDLGLTSTLSAYRAAYGRHKLGDPQVFSFRLEGVATPEALGELAALVLRRVEIEPTATVAVMTPQDGGAVAVNPEVAPASVDPNRPPWLPERGFTNAYNDTNVCFPGVFSCAEARGADLYFSFDRTSPGEDFAPDWAYEHDFKLINENNWNTDNGVCPAPQRNDYWADRDSGIQWDTTMPTPYLDTNAFDRCREHDLTVGSYHPDRFVTRTYDINLIVAPGDHGDSEYQLRAEVLDKDCESSPWCVGIFGYEKKVVMVNRNQGTVPGCLRWSAPEMVSSC